MKTFHLCLFRPSKRPKQCKIWRCTTRVLAQRVIAKFWAAQQNEIMMSAKFSKTWNLNKLCRVLFAISCIWLKFEEWKLWCVWGIMPFQNFSALCSLFSLVKKGKNKSDSIVVALRSFNCTEFWKRFDYAKTQMNKKIYFILSNLSGEFTFRKCNKLHWRSSNAYKFFSRYLIFGSCGFSIWSN